MSIEKGELGQATIDACLAMGFACAGIARAEPTSRRVEFMEWIGDGRHGDMAFMTEYVEERLDVRKLLPGARSVIVVADQYAVRGDEDVDDDGANVRIARYARGRDYHSVIKARLHALCDRLREVVPRETGTEGMRFRAFVDTGPAMEREHAARAVMGGAFVGKHTLLIHPRMGSWLLLGGVATTLELLDGGDAEVMHRRDACATRTVDHCGTCTRCIDACPTGAIAAEGWSVDATKCVSYLTLEHRGAVDERFHAAIGDRLIGCDECQAVCPFNAPHGGPADAAEERVNPAYADHEGLRARLPILDVLKWREEDRARVLSGSAAKRASLEMIKRTAVINAANAWRSSRDAALVRAIETVRDDAAEPALVRETARRALDTMDGQA